MRLALVLVAACASSPRPVAVAPTPTPDEEHGRAGDDAPTVVPVAHTTPSAKDRGFSDADLDFCVAETNRYRAQLKQPALRRSAELEKCAFEGAKYDQKRKQAHAH